MFKTDGPQFGKGDRKVVFFLRLYLLAGEREREQVKEQSRRERDKQTPH